MAAFMSRFFGGPAACLVVEKGICYKVRRNESGQPQKRKLGGQIAVPAR